jgi:hypothetical protein
MGKEEARQKATRKGVRRQSAARRSVGQTGV